VCITLYLADQKGWQMNKSDDVGFIKRYADLGAEYLLINDSSFYSIKGISSLELENIGQYKNITIFKIPSKKKSLSQ